MKMKKKTAVAPLFATVGAALALAVIATAPQAGQYSLDFVADITFPADNGGCGSTAITGGSDVWGYTAPDGTEYAIMGVMEGVAVVRVSDMTVIDVIDGPMNSDCYWHRDIKTYGHYAYVVAEMTGTNEGLMILDLSDLPNSVIFVGSYDPPGHSTSHNLSIDTATGFAYICESGGGGFRIVDLADPENPVDVHTENTGAIHDIYALNDIVYVAEGWTSRYSIYDCTNKTNPVRLAQFEAPGGYTHSIWPTDDGQHVMTTEETTDKTCKMWNVSDAANGNVTLVGEWLGASRLAHNTHLMGDIAVVSHYSSGVSIVDISDPTNPVEVANYDTYLPHDDAAFEGCWGVYPYTQNGMIYASDFPGTLTILEFDHPASDVAVGTLPGTADLSISPNPFRGETMLSYQLFESALVRVEIFDVNGELVRELANEHASAGTHALIWDGRSGDGQTVANGSYFQRLVVGGRVPYEVTKRVVKLD